MNQFSINKSRQGFSYQYKFGLLEILKFMISGRLKKAYIDYPYDSEHQINTSIDINIELQNPSIFYIYEVKTGENFKKNKIEELKKVITNLIQFENIQNLQGKKFIVISPDVEGRIFEYWTDFLFIQSNNRKNFKNETQNEVTERVFTQFSETNLEKQEFIRFIKNIKFEIGPKYQIHSQYDTHSELEDLLIAEINNMCSYLSIRGSEIEIPSWTIITELLEEISKCIEKNLELSEYIFKILVSAFSRRRLIKEAIYKKDKEKLLDEIKSDITLKIRDIVKLDFAIKRKARN